jgi:hypothetical protein
MQDRKCTKKYPRELGQETITGDDGYPLYRRRKPGDGGHTVILKLGNNNHNREIEIDNRWVVPYTPLLSKMFKAHLSFLRLVAGVTLRSKEKLRYLKAITHRYSNYRNEWCEHKGRNCIQKCFGLWSMRKKDAGIPRKRLTVNFNGQGTGQ